MTHKDIYTKFMIEYDKANVTSSYPSLTEYEVATVLDKAYHALIAQKITGNNVRRATFESDTKSIADLGPLTKSQEVQLNNTSVPSDNSVKATLPADLLYFLQAYMKYSVPQVTDKYTPYESKSKAPTDNKTERSLPVKLVDHETAMRFFSSAYNMPWIKEPICYIEGTTVYVVYDPLNPPTTTGKVNITYIKLPNLFVKNLSTPAIHTDGYATFFDFSEGSGSDPIPSNPTVTASDYTFECNGTVAEELISLAVAFALENIESSRLNSKLNMRGLEA